MTCRSTGKAGAGVFPWQVMQVHAGRWGPKFMNTPSNSLSIPPHWDRVFDLYYVDYLLYSQVFSLLLFRGTTVL